MQGKHVFTHVHVQYVSKTISLSVLFNGRSVKKTRHKRVEYQIGKEDKWIENERESIPFLSPTGHEMFTQTLTRLPSKWLATRTCQQQPGTLNSTWLAAKISENLQQTFDMWTSLFFFLHGFLVPSIWLALG